tara:strand:- start:2123 stop:4126 length:2004 start_codon:yes stop_codon:yes gene_type:complete
MNRLKKEKSDYLLQHADNPVDWYPWSDEAFLVAEQEDKPVMLSIGYSACHWCHVMAHESFEDDATAEIMNKNFINIKLDKEERPDLDKIYQMSQTIITGKTGGWPLTVFMTPKKFPFFAGTYFPNTERHGLPSFKDILTRVNDFYIDQKKDIELQNVQIKNIFNNLNKSKESKNIINDDLIEKVKNELLNSIDKVHGGFGSAPKFPHINNLEFLIKTSKHQDDGILDAINLTLSRMCCSGIFDHLKGGFFRYSVDELWMIPHFEKMLYDNGPMISILANAFKKTGNKMYLNKLSQTCDWILSEMQSNDGGYYSTIDADSEGIEGKFYVWSDDDLENILNTEEIDIFKKMFVVYDRPNFDGKYHLHVTKTNESFYLENIDIANKICQKLLQERDKRARPGTDKKVLVSWNALVIEGMINAFKVTENTDYLVSAKKSFDFIKNNMWKGGNLYACYHDKACFNAYLDDYAFLSRACLEILKVEWNDSNFEFLIKITDILIKDFQDIKNGGFYFTSDNHEELIYRPKSYMDESLPSGNSITIGVLMELYELTGDTKYFDAVENAIKSAHDSLNRSSSSHSSLLLAAPKTDNSKRLIIIRCEENDLKYNQNQINKLQNLNDNIYFIPNNINLIANGLSDKKPKGNFRAYICQNNICLEPISSIEKFIEFIQK